MSLRGSLEGIKIEPGEERCQVPLRREVRRNLGMGLTFALAARTALATRPAPVLVKGRRRLRSGVQHLC